MLESPRDLAVNSPLDLGALGGDERRSEFSMLLMQQILADDCQLQVFDGPPSKANVQAHITGNTQCRQCVHIAKRAIEREVMGQIHRGSEHELMARALALVLPGRGVSATGPPMTRHVEVRVGGEAAPPASHVTVDS